MAKSFTEQEIIGIINEEAGKLNIPVIIDDTMPWQLYLSGCSTYEGYSNAEDLSVHMILESWVNFVDRLDSIVEKLGIFGSITSWARRPEKILRETIRDLLVHEGRHIEQLEYLKNKGIDQLQYVKNQNAKNYWLRRYEIDAYLVQCTGIRLPLKWVLGV